MLGGDGFVSDVLAHHRSVFAFHQSVVGAAMGPRFGELFDPHFVQQPRHPVVEKLRAVVGMKTANAEGELMQHSL